MKVLERIKDFLEIILFAIIITFITVNFIVAPYKVDGTSMYPNLHDKDFGYSIVFTKYLGLHRFDTVVVDTEEKLLVKRIIGMPNETVEYKNNKLYINGQYYEEDFLGDVYTNDFKVELHDDEYYCLGDNRNVSKDSRYYGPFSKKSIKSSHMMVLFPFTNFGYRN